MSTPINQSMSRRSFCVLSAAALASLGLSQPAWADETVSNDPIVIVHTNDVHCAVDASEGHLGYAKLADYVSAAKASAGSANVTLVDAGDAVQGNAMGTLTSGEYLVDIMNACSYNFAIPGNHEFDYGMTQFNTLVARAQATYLSCNFTDLRTGNLMFAPYAMQEYTVDGNVVRVAFVGVTTPESLTKSSPAHFKDDSGTTIYGFCEDETGQGLYAAVQTAVDAARAAGADYVVLIAHLGNAGITERWSSVAVVQNTTGIDVVIDGHSHEELVQTATNIAGQSVLITQTGTQLTSIGRVVIDPAAKTVSATTPHCTATLVQTWDGSDAAVAGLVAQLEDKLSAITGQVIGRSDVRLVAFEDDNYTWAVRSHGTNLGDFVSDAYLALAWHGGVMADVAIVNGGGLRANLEPGDVTYGDILNVQPYSNQICYVETKGQNILDALEMGAMHLPDPDGSLQHAAGLTYTVRTDIPSSVRLENQQFAGVDGEYRVRDVMVDGQPLDVNKTYKLVSHSYLLIDGGSGMNMFTNDEAVLLDLDSAALIEYLRYDLKGVIGSEYADAGGQGRIVLKDGPDPTPVSPEPQEQPKTDDAGSGAGSGGGTRLANTGDSSGAVVASALTAAAAATAVAVAACGRTRAR